MTFKYSYSNYSLFEKIKKVTFASNFDTTVINGCSKAIRRIKQDLRIVALLSGYHVRAH